MKLSLEQIQAISAGVLNVWEEDGVFHFAKCTRKVIDAWYELDRTLGFRAESTAGVRLDFHTNSKFFAFTPQVKGYYERYEVYVDNLLSYYTSTNEDFKDCARKEIALDGKEHRITLYLPGHEIGCLEAVEIEDGATFEPHKFDKKMFFIGDSITQGWESTWDSLSYAHNVSRFFNANSVIQGVGGAYAHETLFDTEMDFDADIVVVAFGTNDWNYYKTLEEGREQYKRFLDLVVEKYGDKKVFGISPIWRDDYETDPAMGSFESCCDYVKEEIKAHNMILIEGETLVPPRPEFFIEDVLHPNTAGFGLYALNLASQMMKHL